MITRTLETQVRHMARKFPVVTITGPRQSGKTTLCRAVFHAKPYVSLETPDMQDFAREDPRGLLAEHRQGAVFDEIHRVPGLLSYIQAMVDERPTRGRFILTGSANFALLQSLGQSLAGRTALLELMPLGFEEVKRFPGASQDLYSLLLQGSYPAIYDRRLEAREWYPSYVSTYLERDVRSVLNIGDLIAFRTFMRLCAGRAGQLVNLSSMGADAGVSHGTARSWLSVLEAGYVTWRLPPFHANVSKRLVKTPKLHFLDSGLVCHLLGIQTPQQLRDHPLRGAIFETWVVSEILKSRVHRGLQPNLSFFRDRKGLEVDVLVELARTILAVETKSGATIAADFFDGIEAFASWVASSSLRREVSGFVVYGGSVPQKRSRGAAVPWSGLHRQKWWDSNR